MNTSPARSSELSSSVKQKAPADRPKWVGNVEWFCLFTILFSGYLWFNSPVKTSAQFYFRLILLIVGAVGYVLIQVLKWTRTHDAIPR